jgi:hypothetical protein
MAKSDKNALKAWFQNGDYPNQEQFWSWMDSYWHKDELIPIEIIQGLAALLAGKATQQDIVNLNQRIDELPNSNTGPEIIVYQGDGTYTIEDGLLLEKMIIIPVADIELSIGTIVGTSDIMVTQVFTGGEATVLSIDICAFGSDKHIFLNGITSTTTIKFYNR